MYHEIENFRGDVNSATLIAQIPDMIVTWTGFLFQKLIIKQSCLAYDFNQVSKNNSNFLKYQQSALKHEQNIFVSVTFFNCSPRIQPVLYRIYVYPGIRKIKWFTNNLFILLSRRIPNKMWCVFLSVKSYVKAQFCIRAITIERERKEARCLATERNLLDKRIWQPRERERERKVNACIHLHAYIYLRVYKYLWPSFYLVFLLGVFFFFFSFP
jgi:hypothetical protein